MSNQARSRGAVRVGFSFSGVPQTLLMSGTDAKRMDFALLGERVHFRLRSISGEPIGFYFTPEDFFAWKRRGFETLFQELTALGSYSCGPGGKGFIGEGVYDALELQERARRSRAAA